MPSSFTTPTASLLVLAIGASTAIPARAAEPCPCKPEAWAETIAAFAKQEEKEPPPVNAVLFVGSSSIRMWDLKKWFSDLPAINRGFGGSQLCDAAHYADELVVKHRPRAVVVYAGDNDIGGGKPPDQVHGDFRALVEKIHESLPETRIVYISIKPSVSRWEFADQIQRANKMIAGDCAKDDDNLVFVDVWDAMLGEDGRPRKELLDSDGLHLSDAGYELWTELLRPHLEEKD